MSNTQTRLASFDDPELTPSVAVPAAMVEAEVTGIATGDAGRNSSGVALLAILRGPLSRKMSVCGSGGRALATARMATRTMSAFRNNQYNYLDFKIYFVYV